MNYFVLKPINGLAGLMWRRSVSIVFCFMCILSLLVALAPQEVSAQSQDNSFTCYAVADGFAEGGTENRDSFAQDTLTLFDSTTGNTAVSSVNGIVPNMATFGVEAIAFVPAGGDLHGANEDTFGKIDIATGAFTAIGAFGTGQGFKGGSLASNTFDDVDGLGYDVTTGILYGVDRNDDDNSGGERRNDILFVINPATGAFVPGSFTINGQSVDYVEIEEVDGMHDVDDIAIDPATGVMYGVTDTQINNVDGILIIIDKNNGAATRIGTLFQETVGTFVADMEGLTFSNRNGKMYGSTGQYFEEKNFIWEIDKNTAVARIVAEMPANIIDIESIDCLTASAAINIEKSTNGQDADLPPGPTVIVGDPINWTYVVANTGSVALTDVTVTDDKLPADQNPVCTIPRLEPGQNNTDVGIVCGATGVAIEGQYENTATAIGTPADGQPPVQDIDISHYFGFTPSVVGDFVWFDANGDGLQDVFETGVEGVPVKLVCAGPDGTLDTADDIETNQATTSEGTYLFSGINPDTCYVEFDLPPNCAAFTTPNAGSDDTADSDADIITGQTPSFQVPPDDLTLDAGLICNQPLSALGDFVWDDINLNGTQDAGEPGVPGVVVNLYADQCSGTPIQTTATNADGTYLFNVPPGDSYFVQFQPPTGFELVQANVGSDENVDSDANIITQCTEQIDLIANQSELFWDAGICDTTKNAEIALTFGADRDSFTPGQSLGYTLNLANNGQRDATGVKIIFDIPNNTTFDAANSDSGWSCADGRCTLSLNTLAAGASSAANVSVNVDAGSNDALVATATYETDDGCGVIIPQSTETITTTALDQSDEPALLESIYMPVVLYR